MRAKRVLCLLLFAATMLALTACKNTTESKSSKTEASVAAETDSINEKKEEFKSDVDQSAENLAFRGSVLVALNNEIIYKNGFGYADIQKKIKNEFNTVYCVGSVTKQFTAAAVMLLSDRGLLSTEDTLDKYFPQYKYGKSIKIKNLLNMTSGIPDYLNDTDSKVVYELEFDVSENASAEENKGAVKNWIFAQDLSFKTGSKARYSNSGYFLAGDIIEQVSGVTYEEFVTENILKPLDMNSSTFFPEENQEQLALGYEYRYGSDYSAFPGIPFAMGNLYSNTEDLYKWASAIANRKLLSEKAYEEMFSSGNYKIENQDCYYGYGIMISDDKSLYFHTGSIGSYKCYFAFTADGKASVCLMTNYANCEIGAMFNSVTSTALDCFKEYIDTTGNGGKNNDTA